MIETKEPEVFQESSPKTEPPKLWRNWWLIRDNYPEPCMDCGEMLRDGLMSCKCDGPFPLDVAMTRAAEQEAWYESNYAGPREAVPLFHATLPEGERP